MATKTTAVDDGISEFYYRPDIAIDPPLDATTAKTVDNDYFKLKQVKEENVVFDPTEGIKVISTNITSLSSKQKTDEYAYNYATFRKNVEALVKLVTGAGSKITGHIVVKDANHDKYYRLRVDGTKVVAEQANLGWPDGTQSPYPSDGGA